MITPYKQSFRISQKFKNPRPNGPHQGFDLVGIEDKRIFSPVAGIVVRAGWENILQHGVGFGMRVVVRIGTSDMYMYFGHLSEICVKKGQAISPGAMLGREGSTGHSTGSHLHWEIRQDDRKARYRDIASYSNIPNEADGISRAGGFGTELMGIGTLKSGRNDFPYCIYNANLQAALNAAGYHCTPDGSFGPATLRALRLFQTDNRLTVDGKAGALTKAALLGASGWMK